jgi:hypothetical protein
VAQGYFIVFQDKVDPKQIHFQVASATASDPPEDQLALKTDVEKVLTAFQLLYASRPADFASNFRALLALAQCGLVGTNAQPGIAQRALITLKDEIVLREAGQIKNRYLVRLGKFGLIILTPAVISAVASKLIPSVGLFCFSLVWTGAMLGVWLSFASRKAQMGFEDLTLIEKDQLEPPLRLFFIGFLTVLLGLFFYREAIVVEFGPLSTKGVGVDPVVSFLVGAMCGFSEQALPSEFARQASRLFERK